MSTGKLLKKVLPVSDTKMSSYYKELKAENKELKSLILNLQSELKASKLDLENIHNDTQKIRNELHNTHTNTSKLRDELHNVHTNTSKLRDELHNVHTNTSKLRDELHNIHTNTISVKNELHNAYSEIKCSRSEIHVMHEELKNSFTEIHDIRFYLQQQRTKEKSRTPHMLLNFAYHLADHCNLNCKGCDHFSPVADEKIADFDSFKHDIKRLGKLCNGIAGRINLQGGEPLLHPRAIDFAIEARKNFPIAEILFTTNGLLLQKQSEDFWKQCEKYNVSIEITKYPIDLSYEKIYEIAKKYNVSCTFFGNSGEVEKTSYFIPLDLNGKQDIVSNFDKCFHANACIMLKDGRLYTCTIAANVEHFNKYFDKNIQLSQYDSIDIYDVDSFEQIAQFLARPIPFCRYCNVCGREFGHKWSQSKKDITEWVK